MSKRMKLLGGTLLSGLLIVLGGCGKTPTGAGIAAGTASHSQGVPTEAGGNEGTGAGGDATTQSDSTQRGGVLIGSGH
jgi:hypothetical protein